MSREKVRRERSESHSLDIPAQPKPDRATPLRLKYWRTQRISGQRVSVSSSSRSRRRCCGKVVIAKRFPRRFYRRLFHSKQAGGRRRSELSQRFSFAISSATQLLRHQARHLLIHPKWPTMVLFEPRRLQLSMVIRGGIWCPKRLFA